MLNTQFAANVSSQTNLNQSKDKTATTAGDSKMVLTDDQSSPKKPPRNAS